MPDISCPNCGFKPHPDDGPNCTRCNTPIGSSTSAPGNADNRENSYDEKDSNLVGEITLGDDELNIETASQFTEKNKYNSNSSNSHSKLNSSLNSSNSSGSDSTFSQNSKMTSTETKANTSNKPEDANSIKKLTREEVHKIEEDLYGTHDFLSNTEKLKITKNIQTSFTDSKNSGFGNGPIIPPSRKSSDAKSKNKALLINDNKPKPKIADRNDGVAYFAKRIIQITGVQGLREGDYLTIQDRRFVLQKKRVNSNVVFVVAASLAAILLFWLGAYFTAGSGDSTGTVVGIALDEFDKPVEKHVTIRFPEIDRETNTKLDGFFEFDELPPGSHQIEFLLGNEIVGVDHITIVGGELSTISIRPNKLMKPKKTKPKPRKQTTRQTQATTPVEKQASTKNITKKTSTKSASSSTSVQSNNARLVLVANVDGARLKLDGKTIGAGNLTYRNLSPGKHRYSVSKSGYKSVSGNITLSSKNPKALRVTLNPLPSAKSNLQVESDKFTSSGRAAMKEGRLNDAVEDFTKALSISPSDPTSHLLRGEVYKNLGQKSDAYSDYMRAAKIYQLKGRFTKASTAYNRAIKTDNKIVTAYIGRGNMFLSRKQAIAAVADFETVVRLDKRNAQGYLGLGQARYALGNYKKAIKHFKDARSLTSDEPAAYLGLMSSYLKNNEIGKIEKTYKQFVKKVSAQEVSRFRSDPANKSLVRIIDTL